MNIVCIVDKITIDAEGESTIILKTPLQCIDQVSELLKHTQKSLNISIDPDVNRYTIHRSPVEL